MLKPILTLILGLFSLASLAQKKSDTTIYYLKFPSQIVEKVEDADYVIQITPPDGDIDPKLFVVKGYYPNGKLMFMTNSLDQHTLMYHGSYIGFYPNRKRMIVKQYDQGRITGDIITYYPNGKLYNIKTVTDKGGKAYFNQCTDSSGIVIANKGKGRWVVYDDSFEKIYEEGSVHDGVQVGIWKTKVNDSVDIEKTYDYKGRIISSRTIYKNGPPSGTIFTSVDTDPRFPGGLEQFLSFLGKTVRFPPDAMQDKIQGKVVIQFVVEKDGSLSNFKVVSGIGHGCDEEAIKAVRLSSPWIPAIKDGKPVRAVQTVPITFSIENH